MIIAYISSQSTRIEVKRRKNIFMIGETRTVSRAYAQI